MYFLTVLWFRLIITKTLHHYALTNSKNKSNKNGSVLHHKGICTGLIGKVEFMVCILLYQSSFNTTLHTPGILLLTHSLLPIAALQHFSSHEFKPYSLIITSGSLNCIQTSSSWIPTYDNKSIIINIIIIIGFASVFAVTLYVMEIDACVIERSHL